MQRHGEGMGVVRTQNEESITKVLAAKMEFAWRGKGVCFVNTTAAFEGMICLNAACVLAWWFEKTWECTWESTDARRRRNLGPFSVET